jgi:anaerobic dimethyl sulfoxide reductase subunit B (iron-sulfur subunit)
MPYAFTFDASACTGCKACQIACKDKNNLPTGVLWRRVYEVTGGTWTNVGADGVRPGTGADSIRPYAVWENNIFAYNLSIACNHCVHPKCAGVCPVDAYVVRDDGIVYIDETKCMGCGYCSWACPYAAPQYNPELRHMTKCNFCFDNIDAGLPPACVATCPMRVLNFVTIDDGPKTVDENSPSTVDDQGFRFLWDTLALNHPFPLPEFSRTQPHLAIKPHAGMGNGLDKAISNQEEVKPPSLKGANVSWLGAFVVKGFDEFPLVIFTLLGQMAAGMAAFSIFVQPSTLSLLAIGILLGLGGLFSFLHLGTKRNAWRALSHLKKSSLSREVLMAILFGASWLASFAEHWFLKTHFSLLITALIGFGMVYNMASVYHLRAVPIWNTWRTDAAFLMSAGILGLTGVGLLASGTWIWVLLVLLLAAQLALVVSSEKTVHTAANRIRVALVLMGMVGAGVMYLSPGEISLWISILIFLIALTEESIGRWQFYASRKPNL